MGQPVDQYGFRHGFQPGAFGYAPEGELWPDGVITKGRLIYRHLGPRLIRIEEDVEIFGINVPEGYLSDGASAPRWAYASIPRFEETLPAAIIHDIRYDPPDGVRVMTRAQADAEFRRNLKKCGVRWYRQWIGWGGVRLGGWLPWNKNP